MYVIRQLVRQIHYQILTSLVILQSGLRSCRDSRERRIAIKNTPSVRAVTMLAFLTFAYKP
jgi:hypothetical protein